MLNDNGTSAFLNSAIHSPNLRVTLEPNWGSTRTSGYGTNIIRTYSYEAPGVVYGASDNVAVFSKYRFDDTIGGVTYGTAIRTFDLNGTGLTLLNLGTGTQVYRGRIKKEGSTLSAYYIETLTGATTVAYRISSTDGFSWGGTERVYIQGSSLLLYDIDAIGSSQVYILRGVSSALTTYRSQEILYSEKGATWTTSALRGEIVSKQPNSRIYPTFNTLSAIQVGDVTYGYFLKYVRRRNEDDANVGNAGYQLCVARLDKYTKYQDEVIFDGIANPSYAVYVSAVEKGVSYYLASIMFYPRQTTIEDGNITDSTIPRFFSGVYLLRSLDGANWSAPVKDVNVAAAFLGFGSISDLDDIPFVIAGNSYFEALHGYANGMSKLPPLRSYADISPFITSYSNTDNASAELILGNYQ